MGEFDQNPDIDEKEPIPLRDALEKMKPFLMAYEGIQSQEEWEEIMEETMARVPLLKKIVDHYSGPDRVTAKKQNEELERVASTLPKSAPSSVKQFTNRAVISLQSNPGWGFDKKCHFMDKLVWEPQQDDHHYPLPPLLATIAIFQMLPHLLPSPPSVSTSPSVLVFKLDYAALVASPQRPLLDLDMTLHPPHLPPHVTANIFSSLLHLPLPQFFSFELSGDH
ncbi:hypothetical protein PIB30_009022 [Stylosanthes scabra]|uniref:Uncharacterized protein n=1 Tax=Stylosanthes scabra TaxID=79078 RepID=A0ABU6T6Y8_9FABA|nr:hypothetical protein [Stylosanthes scabra]